MSDTNDENIVTSPSPPNDRRSNKNKNLVDRNEAHVSHTRSNSESEIITNAFK